ncbi:MAG: hypothetical protein HDR20_16140 [Lachnospiraceae bacterium]|nr:hypothetical protein [Lachnospiraceae bacterium]
MSFNYLISMKKSRKKPQEGDVFVLQPIKDVFYYGKVIQTNLKSVDSFINGMTLIYIYKYCSNNKVIPNDLENEELLIAPVIVNHQPWWKGYFETIGNVGVSENDRNIDFAFWDILRKKYVDINGQIILLNSEPKYRSIHGLGSYGVVGKDVQKALGRG